MNHRAIDIPREVKPEAVDRNKWHRPLVSIIITHFNYSDHISDALRCILDQTHENWECVVVDDASGANHLQALQRIHEEIGSPKIRLVLLTENGGQIPAFYAGLDATSGDFVCLLDPDDRYAPTFLEEALSAHLNGTLYCPIVSTDQYLLGPHGIMTGCYTGHNRGLIKMENNAREIPCDTLARLLFFPKTQGGWPWSSTSAMMFRRAALNLIRPRKKLAYRRAADSYLANGAHLLGGSLFLTKPLLYRGVHSGNGWLSSAVFSLGQNRKRPEGESRHAECIRDVVEAICANGAGEELQKRSKRTLGQRLRSSTLKRWRRLTEQTGTSE
jgi:glycosyltransferase involved in cell wall biosynthesis